MSYKLIIHETTKIDTETIHKETFKLYIRIWFSIQLVNKRQNMENSAIPTDNLEIA